MGDTWWVTSGQLDEDQKEIVRLPIGGNHLVAGPPGSGKTNLLLLRATQLVRSGKPNVAILMFTRSLRDFIARGTSTYGFAPEKLMTFTKWEQDILREHNQRIDDLPKAFKERRLALAERMTNLVKKRNLHGIFDCLLIDEAQDCLPEEVELFFTLGKTVFAVGDERQRVYRTDDVLSEIEKRVEKRTLKHHYRNGRKICVVADAIGATKGFEPMLPTSQYNEKEKPSTFECNKFADLSAQGVAIGKLLTTQLKAYPGEELLGVISPNKDDAKALRTNLGGSSIGKHIVEEDELEFADTEKRIYIGTMHGAKGLEFRALHIAGLDLVSHHFEYQKNLSYMGVTRAKTSLSMYHTGRLPGYLESAAIATQPEPDPPELDDLFKKDK